MAEEDIIFGKNRHFFGGIEPSNMRKFIGTYNNGAITIEMQLPNDTIINEQTMCTVAGAVIRKRSDRYPADEFDGDLVDDVTNSGFVTDYNIDASSGYYYAAFPYTTQGVYNRNKANRFTVNIPSSVNSFVAKSAYEYTTDTPSIELIVSLPKDVSGAVIRRSQSGYPVSETDAEECMTVDSDGTYYDTNVSLGQTYYYSIFTYSSVGIYNRDISTSVKVTSAKYNYYFGYDLYTDDTDPETRVVYPSGVDNTNFKAAFMNYGTGEFDYGDWPSTPGKYFMPKPCMLTYLGEVAEYLDPNDYKKVEGGIHSSRVSDTSFNGSAMMEWPKIYTFRDFDKTTNVYKFRCSDIPQGEGWNCWCNYDGYDRIVDHFYTSIYQATYIDVSTGTDLRSLSGCAVLSSEQNSTFRSRSVCHGTGSNDEAYLTWDIGLYPDYLLIRDLLVMIGKSTDCQTVFGNGIGAGNKPQTTTGTLDKKGMFWGSDVWTEGVKVFGMENWWGNYAQHIAGWNCANGGKLYGQFTKGLTGLAPNASASLKRSYWGPSYTSYQWEISGYSELQGTNGGYISGMYYYQWNGMDEVWKTALKYGPIQRYCSGSSTTNECDTFKWGTATGSTVYAFTIGGTYVKSVENGPFAAEAISGNELPSYTGAFLSYKPLAKR